MFETPHEEGNPSLSAHRITDAGARGPSLGELGPCCRVQTLCSAKAGRRSMSAASFFFPSPVRHEKDRRSRAERGGALRERRAEEVARRHGSSGLVFERARQVNADRGQQPRARRGSIARRRARASLRVAEIGSAVVAQRSTRRALFPLVGSKRSVVWAGAQFEVTIRRSVSKGIGLGASNEKTTETQTHPAASFT